jgi:hypothetical protein
MQYMRPGDVIPNSNPPETALEAMENDKAHFSEQLPNLMLIAGADNIASECTYHLSDPSCTI